MGDREGGGVLFWTALLLFFISNEANSMSSTECLFLSICGLATCVILNVCFSRR